MFSLKGSRQKQHIFIYFSSHLGGSTYPIDRAITCNTVSSKAHNESVTIPHRKDVYFLRLLSYVNRHEMSDLGFHSGC